jgi:hypothetical protein
MVVILMDAREKAEQSLAGENEPDIMIHEFGELLSIFPERNPQPDTYSHSTALS